VLLFVLYLVLGALVGEIASRYALPANLPRPAGIKAPPRSRLEQIMLLNALLSASMILIIPNLLRLTSRADQSDLGLTHDQFGRNLLRGVIAAFILAPAVYFINITASLIWKPNAHPVMDMIRDNQSGQVVLIAYAMAVVIAPIFEEMLFRGVLQAWLLKLTLPGPPELGFEPGPTDWPGEFQLVPGFDSETAAPATIAEVEAPETPGLARLWIPNILTSMLFAAAHYQQWPAPVPIFLLSLGLGYIYQRTGRLVAPIALHATFNGLSTTLMFLVVFSKLPMPDPVPKPAAGILQDDGPRTNWSLTVDSSGR
jgi:membrane protease YdiL (CAAX protease family)